VTDLATDYRLYRCVIGSRAYGLDDDLSDTDYRGIYLPPADLHWSLAGVPETIEHRATEEVYWELGKFLHLALKANPSILECLFTPLVTFATPLAEELRAMRGSFLSQRAYNTYGGYAAAQFKKCGEDLRTKGELRWKHAMHLCRLMLAGITILRSGTVLVDVGPYKERLLPIRQKAVPWPEVLAWYEELKGDLDTALAETTLPKEPDITAVNAFLVRARRSMVS
jgi:hypothetical protein